MCRWDNICVVAIYHGLLYDRCVCEVWVIIFWFPRTQKSVTCILIVTYSSSVGCIGSLGRWLKLRTYFHSVLDIVVVVHWIGNHELLLFDHLIITEVRQVFFTLKKTWAYCSDQLVAKEWHFYTYLIYIQPIFIMPNV